MQTHTRTIHSVEVSRFFCEHHIRLCRTDSTYWDLKDKQDFDGIKQASDGIDGGNGEARSSRGEGRKQLEQSLRSGGKGALMEEQEEAVSKDGHVLRECEGA